MSRMHNDLIATGQYKWSGLGQDGSERQGKRRHRSQG